MDYHAFPNLRRLFTLVAVVIVIIFGIDYWLKHKSYVFSERDIAAITRRNLDVSMGGNSVEGLEASYGKILEEMRSKYEGHILPDKDLQWVFMNAGGWMGSICILHASITEYVLFFGTAIDTGGHSGRYWANISDTIISGTFYQWREGELKRLIFKPGDTVFHGLGEVTAVSWTAGTWMVEYGRGFIPSTLVFALADSIFSTTDFLTLFYIVRIYIKALLLEVGFYLGDLRAYIHDML